MDLAPAGVTPNGTVKTGNRNRDYPVLSYDAKEKLVENPAPVTKSDRTHLKRICEKAAEELYPWRRGKKGPMDHLKVTERLFRELLIGFWAGHKPLQIQAWNKLMGIALKACHRLYDPTLNTGFQEAEVAGQIAVQRFNGP